MSTPISGSIEGSKHLLDGRAADQKYCHSCGTVLHFSAQNCPQCGAAQASVKSWQPAEPAPTGSASWSALPVAHAYCRGCGQPIHETASSCPKCGAVQGRGGAFGSSPSRAVAAVLALLLGGLGAHKFYLGRIFFGVLYLVFFWTFIPALIAFVEGIYYLTLSDQEFVRRYGAGA